jgi:nucleoside 2-deoxyribosyltransferase
MLDDCKLLLAVLLYDDPGTLIEIGLALERQMPVLVYDPYGRATNLMLTQLPSVVSADLDVIIAGVFTNAWRALNA